ncbi:MAG: septum site-determining protein MinC [Chloroflexi bacterium]|nr:septum site-determining protein MinC [Chloroflexota bacterium]
MIPPLAIKGIKDGLLITLGDGDWPEVAAGLMARLEETPDFFKGAKVILQIGSRVLGAADLGHLRDQLSDREIVLWAVLSDSGTTQTAAQSLGLEIALPQPPELEPTIDPEERGDEAMFVRRTLRSGRAVHHPGHVIVVGDVNAGAEIVAGGDVVVWGKVRGVVHAGANGDENAIICALDLAPTQLRIAGHIAISPERKGQPTPEVARIRDGRIVAEPWGK